MLFYELWFAISLNLLTVSSESHQQKKNHAIIDHHNLLIDPVSGDG